LETCLSAANCRVEAVMTQPDKPSGRGMKLRPPPVKEAAMLAGVAHILQPERASAAAERLSAFDLDLGVVVAYGKLLPPRVLGIPRLGFINIHYSLLPLFRGAAPVQWSLMRGETRTGITVFWLEHGMDTGPVQRAAETSIGPDEDAPALFQRLTLLGVNELGAALQDIAAGRVARLPQSGEPSLAPKLTAADARIDFMDPAGKVHDKVRGLRAGPKAHFIHPGEPPQRVSLLRTGRVGESAEGASSDVPGGILRIEAQKGFMVQCNPGRLWVLEVQPEGKKPLSALDFLNGRRLAVGDRLV